MEKIYKCSVGDDAMDILEEHYKDKSKCRVATHETITAMIENGSASNINDACRKLASDLDDEFQAVKKRYYRGKREAEKGETPVSLRKTKAFDLLNGYEATLEKKSYAFINALKKSVHCSTDRSMEQRDEHERIVREILDEIKTEVQYLLDFEVYDLLEEHEMLETKA